MSIISLRLSDEEEEVIKHYAQLNNMTVSELFRSSVLDKIESDIDLKLYHQTIVEHREKPQDISFDEMMEELDLD